MSPPQLIGSDAGEAINVLGDFQRLKLSGHDTGGLFALVEQRNEPGTGLPPHQHTREDETFFVLEGSVEFTVGEVTKTLGVGDLAYAPRGTAHSFRVGGSGPARMLIHLAPAGLEVMFQELSELPSGPPDLAVVAEVCARYGVSFLAPPAE
jgi:quercetin dioxygenase-like cupin family protein